MVTVQTLNNKVATFGDSNTEEVAAIRQARELSKQNSDVTFYVKLASGSTLAMYRNGYCL